MGERLSLSIVARLPVVTAGEVFMSFSSPTPIRGLADVPAHAHV
jgi:hypothetical protein